MCLEIVLSIDKTKQVPSGKRLSIVERFVCLSYYFPSLLLWYICVQARDIH